MICRNEGPVTSALPVISMILEFVFHVHFVVASASVVERDYLPCGMETSRRQKPQSQTQSGGATGIQKSLIVSLKGRWMYVPQNLESAYLIIVQSAVLKAGV